MKIHLLILCLLVAFLATKTDAQPISSPAMDPNCYFPDMTNPQQIDTVYGSKNNQRLGRYIKNIGIHNNEAFPEILIGGLLQNPISLSAALTGSGFNLHKLNVVKTTSFEGYDADDAVYAHVRSSKVQDIISTKNPKIYWADGQGYFDSSRFTRFYPSISPLGSYAFGVMSPYIAYLSNDSVVDIIIAGAELHNLGPRAPDSIYLYLYHGGQHLLDQGEKAYPDEKLYVDTLPFNGGFRDITMGDLRGSGRSDLLSQNSHHTIFFYKNEKPFTLEKFAHSLYYDTLSVSSKNGAEGIGLGKLLMKALPKEPWDKSLDIFLSIASPDDPAYNGFSVFRGGPDFGSKRLHPSDAELVIHSPSYYDTYFSGIGINYRLLVSNCGDMTGTGNPVLLIQAGEDAGFYSYYFFYVLGKAADDKVDMYYTLSPYGVCASDSLDVNGDNRTDLLMGMPLHYTYEDLSKGKSDVGTLHLLYGSDKIPVHLNPKYSVHSSNESNETISVYPNPTANYINIEYAVGMSGKTFFTIRDILGREIYRDEARSEKIGRDARRLNLPSLPSGTYILLVENGSTITTKQFSILR